jgi:hypothetical protein
MTGGGSTIGNLGRETLTDRTLQRVSRMDISGSQAAISANESITEPTQQQQQPTGAGQITFVVGRASADCSHSLSYVIQVARNGGVGTVSATVEPALTYATGVYQPFPATVLTWGSGDTSVKTVNVTLLNNHTGTNTEFFNLVNPTGGAVITPFAQNWVDVTCN